MKNNEFLKYMAFGLMGVYLFNKYKDSGFSDHYLGAKQKVDSLIENSVSNLPFDENNKNLIKGALSGLSEQFINNHFGVRSIGE